MNSDTVSQGSAGSASPADKPATSTATTPQAQLPRGTASSETPATDEIQKILIDIHRHEFQVLQLRRKLSRLGYTKTGRPFRTGSLSARVMNLLHEMPEGMTARDMALHLEVSKGYLSCVLSILKRQGALTRSKHRWKLFT